MKKILLLLIPLFLLTPDTNATHIIGGDISVKWIGPTQNDFQVQVRLYRSCQPTSLPMPTSILVNLHDGLTYTTVQNWTILNPTITPPLSFGDACWSPAGLCVDLGIFTQNVTIPDNSNGYFIEYNACCRNSSIINLANPSSTGMTFYCEIPDPGSPSTINNSSPDMGSLPLDAYLCVNTSKYFQFNVNDVDGDSLVYSLVTPLNASAMNSAPIFPYNDVNWAAGYSLGNIVGGASAMSIDQNTGLISASPNLIGNFVFAVRVEEFRNGVKIGETRRDVQYQSLACTSSNNNASFTHVDNGNANYSFTNTSTGSYTLSHWSFGDGGLSPISNPNHTFSTNGFYAVVLAIADSSALAGATCSMDYAVSTINITGVTSPLACNAGFTMYTDSSFNGVIVVNSATGSNLTYLWDFDDGNTSNQAFPSYTYTTAGPFNLCLTVDNGNGCIDTFCDSISSGGTVFKQSGFEINIIDPNLATSIDNEVTTSSNISLYPNPSSNQLTIISSQLNIDEISIINITGKTIKTITNNSNLINVSDLSKGIYFLQIKSNDRVITKKFIKE
ncbi:MAG: hypothetical protein COB15_02775 [Flavobacteriales bacterium]|nr:MAG: hypothetical protein COB15_02775 [Flavobacteriales bacterium]